jgi:hypothetical protein
MAALALILGAGTVERCGKRDEEQAKCFRGASERAERYFSRAGMTCHNLFGMGHHALDDALRGLSDTNAGDGIIDIFVYFVGHASLTDGFRLLLSDSEERVWATGFDMRRLLVRFQPYSGRRIVLLLDCCFAAGANDQVRRELGTVQVSPENLRGVVVLAACPANNTTTVRRKDRTTNFANAVFDALETEREESLLSARALSKAIYSPGALETVVASYPEHGHQVRLEEVPLFPTFSHGARPSGEGNTTPPLRENTVSRLLRHLTTRRLSVTFSISIVATALAFLHSAEQATSPHRFAAWPRLPRIPLDAVDAGTGVAAHTPVDAGTGVAAHTPVDAGTGVAAHTPVDAGTGVTLPNRPLAGRPPCIKGLRDYGGGRIEICTNK